MHSIPSHDDNQCDREHDEVDAKDRRQRIFRLLARRKPRPSTLSIGTPRGVVAAKLITRRACYPFGRKARLQSGPDSHRTEIAD